MGKLDEEEELRGKVIEWAGVVIEEGSYDEEFVVRCTDGTICKVSAWQREGEPTGMCPHVTIPPTA
jgi:hypothetical protein